MKRIVRQRWIGHALTVFIVYLGVMAMLTALQRQMIYFPERDSEAALRRAAETRNLQAWQDDSGELLGWRQVESSNNARRVVVFHGNAGYALHRDYYLSGFQALADGWTVYLFEYPGYGARPGEPSEDSIKQAAVKALESLLADDPSPAYLLGESLGSGVATYLAGRFPERVAGLLLVTPFTSLGDVAAGHYPFMPVRTLLSERYDSVAALTHYQGPVAFLLAGSDEVVPTELGQQLYDSYKGPKWLRIEAGAGHNTLPMHPQAGWWQDVSDFFERDASAVDIDANPP